MKRLVFVFCCALGLGATADASQLDLQELYRHLHQNPELSYQEGETSAFLAQHLQALGYQVTTGVGGHGLVATMAHGKGKTLLIRADMDALPVPEQTGLPFASTKRVKTADGRSIPVMHACGHDVHMTVLLGVAEYMAQHKEQWRGKLLLVGQPAEERGGGAKAMLDDGLYDRFGRPDYALALHDSASLPVGTIGYTPGFALASVDSIDVLMHGVGGHGAYPHTTKDPVVLAAELITQLQTIVSREINPLEPAVLTVGSIHGGTKHNIIPDQVKLQLTLRAYSMDVRQQVIDALKRMSRGLAAAHGLPEDKYPEVIVAEDEFTPSTYNNPALADMAARIWKQQFGPDKIRQVPPVMGGEDFGRFGAVEPRIPSLIFWLGAVPLDKWQEARQTGRTLPSLHSPFWAPDAEHAIPMGVQAMTALARSLLAP
jgi:hippurate hydrolase